MTKSLYPKGKEKMLAGHVAWDTAVIKVHLVTGDYAYGAGHEFLSDVGANTVGNIKLPKIDSTR